MSTRSRRTGSDSLRVHRAIHCTLETLELRRLLCTFGHEEPGEPVHLYDAAGDHLNLSFADPAAVDFFPALRVNGDATGAAMGPAAMSDDGGGSSVAAANGALNGKIAYMNAGHGWTYGSSWLTQRPEYQEMVEDFTTQDQMTY